MLKKIAYTFTPNTEHRKQLERSVRQYVSLCERLADMAREQERETGKLPTTIDLNNLARKTIDTNEEGIPYRFVGLAAARVIKALKVNRFHKFHDPEDGSKYLVDLDEKTVSLSLAGDIKKYPKFELSIATWEGRMRDIACELDEAMDCYLDEFCRTDSKAGYPLLMRVSAADNIWGVVITVSE